MFRELFFGCLVLFLSTSLTAETISHIELTDGTTIQGEVISLSHGRYVIRSPTLGRLEVEQNVVSAIRQGAGSQGAVDWDGQIQSLQQRISSDPELMRMILALQSDPQLQMAIKDPAFMQLLMTRDLEALQRNPRFRQLLSNPSILEIMGSVGGVR